MNDATKNAQRAAQHADAAYDELLDKIAKTLIDFAGNLKGAYGSDRWARRFATGNVSAAEVGSWAVGHLTHNLMANLRIDLVSKYAHDASAAHAELARAQKAGA
jgi:hypothetical protein